MNSGPGLPERHPWPRLRRWGIVRRAFFAMVLVGSVAGALLTAADVLGFLPAGAMNHPLFVLTIAAFGAGSAAVIGPAVRQFFPFSQAILIGMLSVGLAMAFMLALSFSVELLWRRCIENESCASVGTIGIAVILLLWLYGLPVFAVTLLGYELAIWMAGGGKAARLFWPVFAAVLAVYVTFWALVQLGVIGTAPWEQVPSLPGSDEFGTGYPPGDRQLCEMIQSDGSVRIVPCQPFYGR